MSEKLIERDLRARCYSGRGEKGFYGSLLKGRPF